MSMRRYVKGLLRLTRRYIQKIELCLILRLHSCGVIYPPLLYPETLYKHANRIWIASNAWEKKEHFTVNCTMDHSHSFTFSKREDSRTIAEFEWSDCVIVPVLALSTNPLNHAALTRRCIHIVSLQPPLWPLWLCARITPGWPLTSACWGVSPLTTSPCSSGRLSLTLRSVFNPFLLPQADSSYHQVISIIKIV